MYLSSTSTKGDVVKYSFDEVMEDVGLTELTEDQRHAVLRKIHPSAWAARIAYSETHLLIQNSNLKYYAGLEYDEPMLEIQGQKILPIALYESDGTSNTEDVLVNVHEVVEKGS